MADDDPQADAEFDPKVEPDKSDAWLNLITDAEKAFNDYQDRADNIDKLYADLGRLAQDNRQREFQIFWANIQVIGPSIYSRPPVPVVSPMFDDKRPVPVAAADLLERACTVALKLEDIDEVMRLIRDDLSIQGRGVPWLRLDDDDAKQRVCIEHLDRKDFLHDPARKWKEVGWVARRAWMTRDEMRKRFGGDAYKDAEFEVKKDEKDNGATGPTMKAGVWELWSKTENRVVWVSKGVEVLLDKSDPPHLTLEGFFPCPRPAYGTTQRRSLVPVPDVLFYKDQLEEINEFTARISALAEGLKLKGFYPSGAGEIADAVEAALKSVDNRAILIPVANWAMFGNGSAKDTIVWLPLDMVAKTITELIELRKQLIDDVYQITGLSDIMRGSTEASETATAQQLKAQYGSVRVRDRQAELVRVARDICRIAAEIMAENFSQRTLVEMTQIELPTDAEIKGQISKLEREGVDLVAKVKQVAADPRAQAIAKQQPEALQQAQQQAEQHLQGLQEQIGKLKQQPTIDAVMKLLRAQSVRPFVLDIETDSTIQPDEDAAKKRATEFVTAVGGFIGQAVPLVEQVPQIAPLAAAILKYAAGVFRSDREVESAIDEFADQMGQASQQKGPNPEQQAAQQKMQQDAEAHKQSQEAGQQDAQIKVALAKKDMAVKAQTGRAQVLAIQQKAQDDHARHQQDMAKGALELQGKRLEVAKLMAPQRAEVVQPKPPAESINYGDLPPAAQSQMLRQAGINVPAATLAAHAAKQDAKDAAALKAKTAAKPAAKKPVPA